MNANLAQLEAAWHEAKERAKREIPLLEKAAREALAAGGEPTHHLYRGVDRAGFHSWGYRTWPDGSRHLVEVFVYEDFCPQWVGIPSAYDGVTGPVNQPVADAVLAYDEAHRKLTIEAVGIGLDLLKAMQAAVPDVTTGIIVLEANGRREGFVLEEGKASSGFFPVHTMRCEQEPSHG